LDLQLVFTGDSLHLVRLKTEKGNAAGVAARRGGVATPARRRGRETLGRGLWQIMTASLADPKPPN